MTIKKNTVVAIKKIERDKFLQGERDFIDDGAIAHALEHSMDTSTSRVRDILQKSLSITTLTPDETATLLNVSDPQLIQEMEETALLVKKQVYDNRIVTFAPLYMSNKCVNNCQYCNFRRDNKDIERKTLSLEEVRNEVKTLAGKIGHKRLIVVYGEHCDSDADYIAKTIKEIYSVKEKTRKGWGQIRRVNVNAAPMSIDELKKLTEAGIGTYQVFMETYNRHIYHQVHPEGTFKNDYRWRLYSMHRAFEAGIDDVGLGVLFGLADWKFDVMGLLYHARELESRYGVGPHTISFPRLMPAHNTPHIDSMRHISDQELRKAVVVLRLSVPHTGMIMTARENAEMRRSFLPLGITQTDASSKIELGAYGNDYNEQHCAEQQFTLGDTRTLDTVIRELAEMGYITSFCTAGYRCGRTGKKIMDLLCSGKEANFCKLNAVLTFREWLDDFATEETKIAGENIIKKEINEIKDQMPKAFSLFMDKYSEIGEGARDLYF